MRTAFFKTIEELAAQDKRIMLVVGDIGFGVVEPFKEKFPDQYVNGGVAEQNMIGLATGMALEGHVVFVYSIANFPTMRCLEQIRNDACYHDANVNIVAVGGGLAYGALGMSHHATEDIAIMRALPNMTVIAPGDPMETAAATRAVVERPGPSYLRLGRAGEPVHHEEPLDFSIGKAIRMCEGDDLTLITTGAMLGIAHGIVFNLRLGGIKPRVLSMHTVKPLDEDEVRAAARETRAIFTLEEHSVLGGLGGAVAEVVAEYGDSRASFTRLGLGSIFMPRAGDRDYLLAANGLSASILTKQILQKMKERA